MTKAPKGEGLREGKLLPVSITKWGDKITNVMYDLPWHNTLIWGHDTAKAVNM